ncbi:MAG: hypothetical protein HKN35_13840 [Woeseia sp.]|nr:nucleotidyltransferase family protein [Woeseia sp.]MBT8095881.1 nucleotidyltransferase family protein [Woeseia sp.]NNE61970.1 hypothetical protein [Woeseia sp.]
MSFNHTFITRLLRYYHGCEAVSADDFTPPNDDQITYLCDLGLGPVAFNTYGKLLQAENPDGYSLLQSADLTTRVIYRQMESAAAELIKDLQNAGIKPVLLKGISTAFEYYSPPHLRLMGDIDILIAETEADAAMSRVAELGYEISDQDWQLYRKKGHHHLPAAYNPDSGITVEVHTGLFVPNEPMAAEPLFQPENLSAHSTEFDYKGIRASRFSPELQFVYTIAHWGVDGGWAINLASINDVVHILRRHEAAFDFELLSGWVTANPWIRANVFALVSYLGHAGMINISPSMEDLLTLAGKNIYGRRRELLAELLQKYPMNGSAGVPDPYEMERARSLWVELTRPGYRDTQIPLSRLRIAIQSIHHGKYNPLRRLLRIYRYLLSVVRPNAS